MRCFVNVVKNRIFLLVLGVALGVLCAAGYSLSRSPRHVGGRPVFADDIWPSHPQPVDFGATESDMYYPNAASSKLRAMRFESAEIFNEGLAAVQQKGRWGFVDYDGGFAIPPTFEKALGFSEGVAAVQQNGLWGLIRRDGSYVVTPRFTRLGVAWDSLICFEKDGKVGYLDTDGQVAIEPRFVNGRRFSEGLAAIAVRPGEWGFIDRHGNLRIDARFDAAESFADDRAPVLIGRTWGCIDHSGKLVIPATFNRPLGYSHGGAYVRIDGIDRVVDVFGNVK